MAEPTRIPDQAATTTPAAIETWWTLRYHEIMSDLGFDEAADEAATHAFARIVRTTPGLHVADVAALRLDGLVVIAGAADRLRSDLQHHPPCKGEHVVAADAAASILTDFGLTPHLVVTDLDGDIDHLVRLNASGTPLAVHAHGDNQEIVRRTLPRLTGSVLPTRQTPGPDPADIMLPGGFTDGDRAVFIATRLGATSIRLIGFDLEGPPGKGSPTADPVRKRRKLAWARRNLEDARRLGAPLEPLD